ncbi:MAG: hypothetical protein CMH57_02165 [Myxococcales bacterium]|nr:hypothetical protein [Myxococcales bacterium]
MRVRPTETDEARGAPDASARGAVPGDVLLHPAAAASVALIVFTDVVLKPSWPGVLSGKLADVGICFLLPLALVALFEWLAFGLSWLGGRPWRPAGRPVHTLACVIAALYFAALQLSPSFVELHLATLHAAFPGHRFVVTPDPWDLLTSPMTLLAWLHLGRLERSAV